MRSFLLLVLLPYFVFAISETKAANQPSEIVSFSIATAPPTPFQRQKLGERVDNPSGPELKGRLALPGSDKPVPAVVMVLPCYEGDVFASWAGLLKEWGYATLSFTRCNQQDKIFQGPIRAYDWKEGAEAAFGALN